MWLMNLGRCGKKVVIDVVFDRSKERKILRRYNKEKGSLNEILDVLKKGKGK
jgi:predicted kinase